MLSLGCGKEGSGSGLGREDPVLPGLAGPLSVCCSSERTVPGLGCVLQHVGFFPEDCDGLGVLIHTHSSV